MGEALGMIETKGLVAMIEASDSTRDRLEHTGILRPEIAKTLGIVGVGGRASGMDLDVRRDHQGESQAT